jgi:uncharacterized alpha-E superfamily protein
MAMLSRVADSLYWMGRYIERAEQTARQLEVSRDILVDLSELDRQGARAEWEATLAALCVPDVELQKLVFDVAEPSSIVSCLLQARENARQVREVISSEMWERLNQTHWSLKEASTQELNEMALTQIFNQIQGACATWSGMANATMHRSEAWAFLRLGKFVERLDRLCRALIARQNQRDRSEGRTHENVAWIALLRSTGALEAYRKSAPTGIDPRGVFEFVVFEQDFPRSLCFCATEIFNLERRLQRRRVTRAPALQRCCGRLAAKLEHGDVDEMLQAGVEGFATEVLSETRTVSSELQKTYFLQ